MVTFPNKETSIASVTIALALAVVAPKPVFATLIPNNPILAQATVPNSFPFPTSVPSGTTVRVDGSTSMVKVNEALKQRFEQQFSGTNVELNAQGSDAALKALIDGKIDLAAIGRPLTQAEKAQGLVQVPLSRQKIAIIVSPSNPFQGDIAFEQFARIFRGEITDWSQLKGSPGAIQLVDRPDYSDTRQAFPSYKVFQNAPFRTGSNVTQVSQDSTEDVIKQLGNNGIGYAIADQVMGRSDVRIIPMHKVFPDNPKYPFSQSLTYVYKAPASPAVQPFVGYATAPSNQQVIKEAVAATTTEPQLTPPSPEPVSSPPSVNNVETNTSAINNAETNTSPVNNVQTNTSPVNNVEAQTDTPPANNVEPATSDGKIPWWWLLLLGIPLLGALLWLLLKDREKERRLQPFPSSVGTLPPAPQPAVNTGTMTPVPAPQPAPNVGMVTPVPAPQPAPNVGTVTAAPAPYLSQPYSPPQTTHSYLFLVPYDGKNAYAYWQTAPGEIDYLRQLGGQELMLRLYDVTGIPNPEHQNLYIVQQFGCKVQQNYLLLTLPAENRDYIVELGYLTLAGGWLPLTRSGKVRVAPTIPTSNTLMLGSSHQQTSWLTPTTTSYVGTYYSSTPARSRLFLVPYDGKKAYTYWEIAPAEIEFLYRLGGQKPMLRLYDVTGIADPEHHTPQSVQEFGCKLEQYYLLLSLPSENRDYMVELGYLTQSGIWLPLTRSETVRVVSTIPTSNFPRVGSGNGDSAWLAPAVDNAVAAVAPSWHIGEHHSPIPAHSRLFLVPYDGKNVYAYWEISPLEIESLQRRGGKRLMLRLYDVTDILDPDDHPPQSLQQFSCEAQQQLLLITLPAENRDYRVELGYLTEDDEWLPLTHSETVRLTTDNPTGNGVLILVVRDDKNGYTYLEIPPTAINSLKQ